MKRSVEEGSPSSHKKHKSEHRHHQHLDGHRSSSKEHREHKGTDKKKHDSNQGYEPSRDQTTHTSQRQGGEKDKKHQRSHSEALAQLPAPTTKSADVPAYVPFSVPNGLPPIPPVKQAYLAKAAFKHKSLGSYDRNSTSTDMSYERLEFLGDAYIELIASRLIFERFGHLPAGQQSQLRELLVKNETLAEYSRSYKFDGKVEAGSMEKMIEDVKEKDKWKGNKGWNKILGDVFEAYVAAVILADAEDGFSVVEAWLTALWAPKILEAAKDYRGFAQSAGANGLVHADGADLLRIYNPNAKMELQKRIMGFGTKLAYEKYREPLELKGDQLGQNRHFVALYLTGYGYEGKLLGKGEGKNKVEAGNWAATQAMYGECKGVVKECEERLRKDKEARLAQKAAEEEKQKTG